MPSIEHEPALLAYANSHPNVMTALTNAGLNPANLTQDYTANCPWMQMLSMIESMMGEDGGDHDAE